MNLILFLRSRPLGCLRRLTLWLCALTFTAVAAARTPESAAVDARRLELPLPDGGTRTLALSSRDGYGILSDGADELVLPLAAPRVLAFGLLSNRTAALIAQQPLAALDLSGASRSGLFLPESLEAVTPPPLTITRVVDPLPAYAPLLPELATSPYGAEGRAHVETRQDGAIQLDCAAGRQPAGLLLQSRTAHLPVEPNLLLSLRLQGEGHVTVLVADAQALGAEAPLTVAEIEPLSQSRELLVRLPASGWSADDWQAISFACPATRAHLTIEDLHVTYDDALPSPQLRAFWVWEPEAWLGDAQALIARLRRASAREVFVTVPLSDEHCHGPECTVAHAVALRGFLAGAHAAGIGVWAVAGDPSAVLPDERDAWVGRAMAYARFNQEAPADGRLAGIQYDIEPYLLPGFGLAAEHWMQAYADLLTTLHQADPALAVDAVVPWWFGRPGTGTERTMDRLAGVVDRLTVMDYRTDPAQQLEAALPFLSWARRTGHDVRLALESGPLPDQEMHRFVPAASGTLWVAALGDQMVYVLFDRAAPAGANGHLFADRGGHLIRATRTTYHQHTDELWRAVSRLEHLFGATRAFAGVAIHGMDSTWF